MVKYIVYYLDDFNQKHMAFVRTLSEVNFLKERFYEVSFEVL